MVIKFKYIGFFTYHLSDILQISHGSNCSNFFYTIMEVTQYLQYQVINQCDNEINKNLTKFTWILEWIQPLMWNIVYLYITKSNKDVFRFSIFLSLLIFIAGIAREFLTIQQINQLHMSYKLKDVIVLYKEINI